MTKDVLVKSHPVIRLMLGLAPDGGLPSRSSRLNRWWSLTPPFHSYHGATLRGDLFSVALAVGSLRLDAIQHRVLWSSDFPHDGYVPIARPPGPLTRKN